MHPKRLVVVAQDKALLASLEFTLRAEGFSVTSSASLAEVDPRAFDLAVIDGRDLHADRQEAAHFFSRAGRVVLLGDDPRQWLAHKAVKFVQKPLRGNELLTAINIALVDVA